MIRNEEKRLREVFQRLMLIALAAPAATVATAATPGCSSSSSSGTSTQADSGTAAADASMQQDATSGGDDAEATESGSTQMDGAALDAGACPPGTPYHSEAGLYQLSDAGDAGLTECYYFVDFPCAPSYTTATGANACYLTLAECSTVCTLGAFVDCRYQENAGCVDDGGATALDAGGKITIECGLCNGVGRRPSGLLGGRPSRSRSAVGEYFARVAHLEAASVFAFERLRDELQAHGAPSALVACAERSARDEVRHARVTSRLARRHGSEPAKVRVRRSSKRALEAIARENAVEGCVRETFGALVATWQARNAGTVELRETMAKIAADETRHAALAWAVAKWAEGELPTPARRRVALARRAAARALEKDLTNELPAAVSQELGLPDRVQARTLLREMSEMWA